MGKNIGKYIRKSLSGKQSQKLLDHAIQSATYALKTSSKKVIQKAPAATADLIGNEIANKITKVSKNSRQNNFELVINENYKELPKERYISAERRKKDKQLFMISD